MTPKKSKPKHKPEVKPRRPRFPYPTAIVEPDRLAAFRCHVPETHTYISAVFWADGMSGWQFSRKISPGEDTQKTSIILSAFALANMLAIIAEFAKDPKAFAEFEAAAEKELKHGKDNRG